MNQLIVIKRRGLLWLLAGWMLLAAFFALRPRGPQEPVHQGKPLTRWIHESHDIGIFEQTDELKKAMLAMGTNAIPYLLSEFTRPISPWRKRIATWMHRERYFRFSILADEERILVAGRGLMLLGTNAAPALPVLLPYLADPARVGLVRDICIFVGDPAVTYLNQSLTTTNTSTIPIVVNILHVLSH